ncbi:tyrosine-type recombinase/integrase [Brachybacterium paraconglomeratum]|uniref:tyrosine-type recombinase/integrase n=1 Tax=Brachybacterium paraconglomeratum TaxID=173362 RepID=UPI00380D4B6E
MDAVELLPLWTAWLRASERSETTVRLREYHVRRYLGTVPAETDPLDLEWLVAYLANPRWRAATRRSARTSLRIWTTWLHRTGRIIADPLALIPPARSPKPLPRPCPDPVIRKALFASDTRVRAMITLAAEAGLRRAEIAVVARPDIIDERDGISLIVHGKGRRERTVPLTSAAATAVTRQFNRVSPELPWLFPSIGRYADTHIQPVRVGELINGALPGSWSAHTLRHRFATEAYRRSRDLLLVQTLMGHSKPETTAIYVGLDTAAARSVVDGISLVA